MYLRKTTTRLDFRIMNILQSSLGVCHRCKASLADHRFSNFVIQQSQSVAGLPRPSRHSERSLILQRNKIASSATYHELDVCVSIELVRNAGSTHVAGLITNHIKAIAENAQGFPRSQRSHHTTHFLGWSPCQRLLTTAARKIVSRYRHRLI